MEWITFLALDSPADASPNIEQIRTLVEEIGVGVGS
jgi:hypothetical protein